MQLQNIILVMGPPGSGKGTQSKLLGDKLGFTYFSTGALLRDIAKEGSEFGKKIADFIDNGIIIPDEMMTDIFRKKIQSLDNASGIILDGFPRTIGQAKILENLLGELGQPEIKVLFLEVDKANLIDRINKRGSMSNRADDDASVIEKRFDEYQVKTAPVKEYYEQQNLLVHINGDQPIEVVHQEILNRLGLK